MNITDATVVTIAHNRVGLTHISLYDCSAIADAVGIAIVDYLVHGIVHIGLAMLLYRRRRRRHRHR